MATKKKKKWIQGMHLKKGALHRELGIVQGKRIPVSKLEKAAHSSNPLERKRAEVAETLSRIRHKL